MNEHDKLFKSIESIKENAADLIAATFPPDVLEKINLSSLEHDKSSYVDDTLKEYFTDLIYTCETAENKLCKITLLFEHKSYEVNLL